MASFILVHPNGDALDKISIFIILTIAFAFAFISYFF